MSSTERSRGRCRGAAPRSAMLPIALLLCVVLLGMGVFQKRRAEQGAKSVAWQPNVSAALATATSEHRPVLMSFTSPTCGYCRRMDADVLPDAGVQAALKPFVTVRVNLAATPDVAMRYGIEGVPAFVVTDATGKALRRTDGYQSAAQFTSFLREAATAVGG